MNAPVSVTPSTTVSRLRWHIERRMLNERWRVCDTAGMPLHWHSEIDLDEIECRLNERLDGPLTYLQRIEVYAALNVIDQERNERDLREDGCRSYHPEIGYY